MNIAIFKKHGSAKLINSKKAYWIWVSFLGTSLILGTYAAFIKFTSSREIYGTTHLIPLGILISTYIFFVVTGTGLCVIASLGHVFKIERFKLIAKRAIFLSIITLLCGFAAIGLELERPFRLMAYNFTSPQFKAPIWWMGLFYSLCLPLLICEFVSLLRDMSKTARVFGTAAFISEIIATSILGMIFGILKGRPFWHGAYMSVYFLLTAVSCGAAFIICFITVTYRFEGNGLSHPLKELLMQLGKILAMFITFTLIVMCWKAVMSFDSRHVHEYGALMALLKGPLSLNFWIFEVSIGSLIPLLLLTIPGTRTINGTFIAAFCLLLGMFASRYNWVIVGQIYPVWGGEYGAYAPNHLEWFIVLACMGACLLIYTLGTKFLPLKENVQRH